MSVQGFRRAIILSILLFSFPALTFAQRGKITGQVYDAETGAPLPGANVIIENIWESGKSIQIENKQGAATDEDGFFVILNVTPGTYDVSASMIGYAKLVKQQVNVNIDLTSKIDFPLESSAIEGQAVEVVAERDVIRPDISGTQEIIKTQRIEETPVLRMDEFINKIKGVDLVASNEGQGLSIRGGSIRETDVRVDGISLRDPRSDNSYLSLNSTSVEELQVLTGGFEAKYGGIRSGLVNVVTKEGSREKYSVSLKIDYTPSNQYKYFGSNPWSSDSWMYRVFADTIAEHGWQDTTGMWHSFALEGVPTDTAYLPDGFPDEEAFRNFRGWNNQDIANGQNIGIVTNPRTGDGLTPEQRRDLWVIQHPSYAYADKPDMYLEGSITGPVPGSFLPLAGGFLERSTFLLAGKYEDSQLAFPVGPRNSYIDWNSQLKITTRLNSSSKLSINGMYANINTVTAGRPTTFGGALIDNSSRFNFLSSTETSVNQQAQLLAGSIGLVHMYNRSRLQYYDQRYMIGGMKYTHNLSSRSFLTLEGQFSFTDHQITPFNLDTSSTSAWVMLDSTHQVLNVPTMGSPNASTNFGYDITDFFALYGGLQQADTSHSWIANFKGDFTSQIGQHHQFEAGFDFRYNYLFVNSGTWAQAKKSWTPDTWQYFTAQPIMLGAYIQDKLEFQGMVANIGLRMDYFNPQKNAYIVKHPLDTDYADLYNVDYQYLPGDFGSWEKWVEFRKMLDNPPGWPVKDYNGQLKVSPRLGVSFPITSNSKLFFNYGHFYQRPNVAFLYHIAVMPGATNVPSTDLTMARTVAYEFGYEQRFLRKFLLNISMYYKNIEDEPLNRTYVDYWEEMHVNKYYPDAFGDIRGIEARLEKNIGRFLTFWGNFEYMVSSHGSTGLMYVYANKLKANEQLRYSNVTTTEARPRAQGNINLHTPPKFGPGMFGMHPLSNIFLNFFVEWRDGGSQIINPQEPVSQQKEIGIVDYSNLDLRASKSARIGGLNIEFVLTVQNLLNQKRLAYWNMSSSQYDRYKTSLHLPFESGDQHGNDKLGTYDKDYIDTGWFTAPLFLNPRRVLLGFRVNF